MKRKTLTEDLRGTDRERHNHSSIQNHYLNSAYISTTLLDLCNFSGASSSTPVFTASNFPAGFFSAGNPGDSSMKDPVWVGNCLEPVDGIGPGCGLTAQFYYE